MGRRLLALFRAAGPQGYAQEVWWAVKRSQSDRKANRPPAATRPQGV